MQLTRHQSSLFAPLANHSGPTAQPAALAREKGLLEYCYKCDQLESTTTFWFPLSYIRRTYDTCI